MSLTVTFAASPHSISTTSDGLDCADSSPHALMYVNKYAVGTGGCGTLSQSLSAIHNGGILVLGQPALDIRSSVTPAFSGRLIPTGIAHCFDKIRSADWRYKIPFSTNKNVVSPSLRVQSGAVNVGLSHAIYKEPAL